MSSGRSQLPSLLALFAVLSTSAVADPSPANAQVVPPARRTWMTYAVDYPLPRRFALLAEAQGRFDGASLDQRQQLLLRAGLGYSLAAPIRFAAGWGYVRTEADSGGDVPEHRIWEQAQLSNTLGRVGLSNRVRIEQRWVAAEVPADTAGGSGGRRWARSQRVRYQLRGAVPVGGCLPRLQCYVALSDELFADVAGGDGRALSPNQNRAALAVGSRVRPALRVELGYLNQADVARAGTVHVRTHALTVGMTAGGGR